MYLPFEDVSSMKAGDFPALIFRGVTPLNRGDFPAELSINKAWFWGVKEFHV